MTERFLCAIIIWISVVYLREGGGVMLRDLLYEESATSSRANAEAKYYTFFLVLSIICFVFAGISAFFATSVIQGVIADEAYTTLGKILAIAVWILFVLTFAGVGLLFWFIKKRFNLSYDYTFVEDELRVTKVFNGRSRKYFTTISADSILKIGWCDKPSFQNTMRGIQGKPKYLTPNKTPAEEKDFIYLLVGGSLGKTLYVLECRQILMEYLVQSAGVNKLERE